MSSYTFTLLHFLSSFTFTLCQVMSDKSLFIERQNFILCHNFCHKIIIFA